MLKNTGFVAINDETTFRKEALRLFSYQARECEIYRKYIINLGIDPEKVLDIESIPFMPIEFFKSFRVVTGEGQDEIIFRSSRTTGHHPSEHHVLNLTQYDCSIDKGFDLFYGKPSNYAILALLPSYLERNDASLVYMADRLIRRSANPSSGFFLNDYEKLIGTIKKLLGQGQRFILLGVTFALLDLAEHNNLKIEGNIVIETGGMKGRRKEMIREELHNYLCSKLGLTSVHSEYGMTELLSQAWSSGNGIYHPVPWMKVLSGDINDPLSASAQGSTGILKVIDLANVNSCAFIATQDIGKVYPDGSFEVLGRLDYSEIRGCNLMAL